MIHDLIRAEFRRVVPGEFGYEEGRFHFKVPLTVKDAKAAFRLMRESRGPEQRAALIGYVENDDSPNCFGQPARPKPPHRRGLWLDLAEPALYVPLHVDGIADLEPFGGPGLTSVEIKSMASGSFLRAVKGHVDYAYRVQMAAAVDGTGLDAEMYVAVRKDTCHLLEVVYTRGATEVSVTRTKTAYRAEFLGVAVPEGEEDWEAALVRHPFEPHLLEQARERVRRILRSTVIALPEREYGPSFICDTCDGTGMQSKAKNTGKPLVKGPKPCPDCEPALVNGLPVGKPSGQLARAELPWQCRYCPSVVHCYPTAKLEIEDERPHFWISREDYQASGITFTNPEATR